LAPSGLVRSSNDRTEVLFSFLLESLMRSIVLKIQIIVSLYIRHFRNGISSSIPTGIAPFSVLEMVPSAGS